MRVGLKQKDRFLNYFNKDYDFSDVPVLFETDDVNCSDVFDYLGKKYSICMVSPHNNFAIAQPIEINEEPEKETNDSYVKCPVCGDEHHDSLECSDEDEEYECGNCGSILSYTSEVTRKFTISVVKPCEIKIVPFVAHAV